MSISLFFKKPKESRLIKKEQDVHIARISATIERQHFDFFHRLTA